MNMVPPPSGEISNLASEMAAIVENASQEQAVENAASADARTRSMSDLENLTRLPNRYEAPLLPGGDTEVEPPNRDPTAGWGQYPHYNDYTPARAPTRWDDIAGYAPLTAVATAAIILLLAIVPTWRKINGRQTTKRARLIMALKQRAASVICAGFAILALSIFVDDRFIGSWSGSDLWGDIVSDGWLSAFGAAIALIGIYHWLARPDID